MPKRFGTPGGRTSTTWGTFRRTHLAGTIAIDFFTAPTVTFQVLHVFFVLSLRRGRAVRERVPLFRRQLVLLEPRRLHSPCVHLGQAERRRPMHDPRTDVRQPDLSALGLRAAHPRAVGVDPEVGALPLTDATSGDGLPPGNGAHPLPLRDRLRRDARRDHHRDRSASRRLQVARDVHVTVWEVVKENAIRRLGKQTLIGYAVLSLVVALGMIASAGRMFMGGRWSRRQSRRARQRRRRDSLFTARFAGMLSAASVSTLLPLGARERRNRSIGRSIGSIEDRQDRSRMIYVREWIQNDSSARSGAC